jgi:hypothetical protein
MTGKRCYTLVRCGLSYEANFSFKLILPPFVRPRAASEDVFEVLYDYNPPPQYKAKRLALKKGQVVKVHNQDRSGWWAAECNGRTGWIPSNYVTPLATPAVNVRRSRVTIQVDMAPVIKPGRKVQFRTGESFWLNIKVSPVDSGERLPPVALQLPTHSDRRSK